MRRQIGLLTLLAATAASSASATGATTPAITAAPTVRPSQALVVFYSPHTARAAPRRNSTFLRVVSMRRPITGERTMLPLLGLGRDSTGRQWLHVRLPGRPNGHAGWIMRAGTARVTTSWHLVVELSRRQVVVYRAGRLVRRLQAVVGSPATPTPVGKFFVEESVMLAPSDPGAPFALALSGRSNVFSEFEGGPGQIALHGRAHLSGALGTATSHGCVRLDASAMAWLVLRIGAGVPVTIVA